MSKTLLQRAKNNWKALGLAAILGCTSGCAIAGGAALQGNAMRTKDPLAAMVLGDALMRYGQAQESRSETNVYVNGQAQTDPQKYDMGDGVYYTGDVVNNRPNGKGVKVYPDGVFYEGEFRDGVLDGWGTFKDAKGKKWEGYWIDGKWAGTDREIYERKRKEVAQKQ